MSKLKTVLSAALLVAAPALASADDLTDAAQGLCDTVKSCALEQIAEQDMTPQMREMMVPMLDNMCTTMRGKVQDVPTGHPLYQPAVKCMRSMQSLTCEQLQNNQMNNTPECKEYERLAKQAAGSQQ